MSRARRFDRIFGIQASAEEEKQRFVHRMNQTVLHEVAVRYGVRYETLFRRICYSLGVNADHLIARASPRDLTHLGPTIPGLRALTNDDFMKTLNVVVSLYEFFEVEEEREWQERVDLAVKAALSSASLDLGVRWKKGMFYPSGAKVLDERLVEDPFDWLDDYPEQKRDFVKAVQAFSEKRFDDAVADCYKAAEGLARKILQNRRTLEKNREELLRRLGLSQEWKRLLSNYINYANEFARHASDKRDAVSPKEAHAYLYSTGLLVRLIVESN
jgi:hypothetical protein